MIYHITDRMCPNSINAYVGNLTESYTDKSNEPNMVAASVIMFTLAGLFFNLNLFSGISDISAILDPKVRLFLSSALSLFLPVMSYLFSEAKNHAAVTASGNKLSSSHGAADLSLRAGIILAWMLLVELLRKKVDEIRMRGYSGTVQRAGRVVWLGSLVFFNIKSTGRKAVFAILWILCATRVVQRIAFTEVGKRSYAHGKNARLMSSYIAQIQEQEPRVVHGTGDEPIPSKKTGDELLKSCNYIVMGEENLLNIEPTADGYKLDKKQKCSAMELLKKDDSGIVTVGKVWGLDDNDKFFTSKEQMQRLKRICLSFALFKLLRRKFEHLPKLTKQEQQDSQDLILKGLCHNNNGQGSETARASSAEAMFQVMSDEINFLSEYYHSVVPVVLASPFFLFLNYFLLNIVVAVLCVMTFILCGNGDVRYAFHSIGTDNYTLQSGVVNIAICLAAKAISSPEAFFSIVDLSITILLFIIYFYEEIWEFFVFLLSNWFMVSMIYNYTSKPRWLRSNTFRGTLFWVGFSIILWLRSKMSHPSLTMKQFSVLNVRWPLKLPLFPTFTSLVVKKKLVPNSVKRSIMDFLVEHQREVDEQERRTPNYDLNLPSKKNYDLNLGRSALQRNNQLLFPTDEERHQAERLLPLVFNSDSVAEVILTWHIATSIMELERRPQSSNAKEKNWSRVAIRLSKYCAYLVAFHPELLPENPEKVELVFEKMKEELKELISCRGYYFSLQSTRVRNLTAKNTKRGSQAQTQTTTTTDHPSSDDESSKVVREGVELGKILMEKSDRWKVLADVWTELIIYLAPSNDEERVIGHEGALVQGSEFITVLWALTTHIGLSRPQIKKPPPTNKPPATTHDIDVV